MGFPGETKENMQETIDYARSLELDWAVFFTFAALPNTQIFKASVKKGYINEKDFDPVSAFYKPTIKTPEFAPEEVEDIKERAILDVCFENNPNLRKYDVNRAIENFKSVVTYYPHFDFANFYLAEAYYKSGQIDTAVTYWKKTLELNPAYRKAEERLISVK